MTALRHLDAPQSHRPRSRRSINIVGYNIVAVYFTHRLQHNCEFAPHRLNQLRYDLRKMRAHALLERDGTRYAYRLTDKGVKVALLFVLFHQRLCGPLAHSLFHHRLDPRFQPDSKLEAALHKADASIRNVIQLLEAA